MVSAAFTHVRSCTLYRRYGIPVRSLYKLQHKVERKVSGGGKTHILGLPALAGAQTVAVCFKLGAAAE